MYFLNFTARASIKYSDLKRVSTGKTSRSLARLLRLSLRWECPLKYLTTSLTRSAAPTAYGTFITSSIHRSRQCAPHGAQVSHLYLSPTSCRALTHAASESVISCTTVSGPTDSSTATNSLAIHSPVLRSAVHSMALSKIVP